MPQTPEAEAFLNRITSLPKGSSVSLDAALQPSLDDELELRKLFASEKTNTRLNDPYVGLVDVFDASQDIRTTRARVIKDEEDLSGKYVMPLPEAKRRKEGSPCMVNSLAEFQRNWTIFSEGALSQLVDWSNVVAAGGAVLACLTPLENGADASKRTIRKLYHSVAYPTSDVDLFLWGMNAEQAEKKIIAIYEAVRDSVPWDVTCVRTKHTVSIHSQYPYRTIQIVLRLYSSPAEILAGFDIDAPCCLYNGQSVLSNPRAIIAMMRQANTVDMSRRSPSYEVRLAKYSNRGFEVYVPTLRRENIDPTIYERSIARIEGLARLLVLEKLNDANVRSSFLESRRELRGRPELNPLHRYRRRRNKFKGDLKANTSIAGLEMNDYDVATLHIPYGPGWDARRIDKLVYQTDLGMNSPFNPKNKNRRLHRHPAFFGTMKECVDDCCQHCPEPIDSDERALQEQEDQNHIRGRISFMEEDPGRQIMSGSFNPIDVGEWSAQVYIGATERFFTAIAAQERETVLKMIQGGIDLHRRDHVGRTALHVAILTGGVDIACDLIEAGSRITARLVDGRSSLHLAAQLGQPTVLQKLFEKSASNKSLAKGTRAAETPNVDEDKTAIERPSSEDDWSSADDGVLALDTDTDPEANKDDDGEDDGSGDEEVSEDADDEEKDQDANKETTEAAEKGLQSSQEYPEDSTDEPDVLDVNLSDWDLGFSPLAHGVLSGSLEVVEELLKEGADVNLLSTSRIAAFHPLTLTILRENEDEASEILQCLLSSGASTSTADDNMRTIFQRAVVWNKTQLVSTILKYDPNANSVLDFPSLNWGSIIFPIVSAIDRGHYSMLATLLVYGAKINFTEDGLSKALEAIPQKKLSRFFNYGVSDAIKKTFLPVETALKNHDDVAQLLISLGADYNVGIQLSGVADQTRRKAIVDWVRFGMASFLKKIASCQDEAQLRPSPADANVGEAPLTAGWKRHYADLLRQRQIASKARVAQKLSLNHADETLKRYQDVYSYLFDIEALLLARGAKTWNEIHPDSPLVPEINTGPPAIFNDTDTTALSSQYLLLSNRSYDRTHVHQHLGPMYDELYEACFTGDNKKVEQLCLPQEESKNTTPLNINVQTADEGDVWSHLGHTPLFAALRGRQWASAKLIMAIATAQYTPSEKEDKFSTKGVDLYDEDSDGDDAFSDSCDSDVTVEQEEITFIDIAKRASKIETDVPPGRMLTMDTAWYTQGKHGQYECKGSLLTKAIYDDDLEMFNNITSLYIDSPLPIPIEPRCFTNILDNDRPDMLDEYIRRTGRGIEIQQEHSETTARNDKNRVYLGLNVHGKKRADLATMNDPSTSESDKTYPIVWEAASRGATKIVEYLAGERPLAAYKHYASIGKDERAYQLRRIRNLGQVLPEWIGWTTNSLGDSPFMAAILSSNLDLLQAMFKQKSKLMISCLHERIKFAGYNALLVAVDRGCTTDVIDYLLERSVSPAVNDSTGLNIYHVLCKRNNYILLDHLLNKLPRDVNEALLAQQSKERFETPLHLAVKAGATRACKLILDFTTSTLPMRNIDGSTPLHNAVHLGYGEIAEIIINAAPPEALYMENGVGETPFDLANLTHKLQITRGFAIEQNKSPNSLNPTNADENPPRLNLVKLKTELPNLCRTIEKFIQDGKLVKGTMLADELLWFSQLMEGKLAAAEAEAEAKPAIMTQEEKITRDICDRKRTLKAISEAQRKTPGKRLLVPLVDVQKSVQGGLKAFTYQRKYPKDGEDGLGLGKEKDEGTTDRNNSFMLSKLRFPMSPGYDN